MNDNKFSKVLTIVAVFISKVLTTIVAVFISKVLTIVAVFISLIGAFFYIRIMTSGTDAIREEVDLQNSIISPFVWFTIIVLIITIIAALLSSASSLAKKPEQLRKVFLSIGILGVVLLISYFLRDGSEVLDAAGSIIDGGGANETSNTWSSTGIWFSIILGSVGLAMFLADMVKSLIKS